MREQVYETLLDLIMNQHLKPGEKLVDLDLATELGVSRTPIRESLRRLEDEGFVTTAANRWTRVADIDLAEANEVCPILGTLESMAVLDGADRIDEARLKALVNTNERLLAAIQSGSSREATRLDERFHEDLVSISTNSELIRTLDRLRLKARRIELFYFNNEQHSEDSVAEHAAILRALDAGNVPAAADAVRQNWSASLQRLQETALRISDSAAN